MTGTVWPLEGRFGAELWHTENRRLVAVEAAGERIALPADPLTAERLGLRRGTCAHSGPFPAAFRFCPECGAPLAGAAAVPASAPWSPPFGAANGLPTLDGAGAPDPDSRTEIALPVSPALGLAVAGSPPILLCCDRVGGWVSGWSEAAGQWIERSQVAPCSLPGWSWSAVAQTDALVLPTDRGPVRLGLDRPRGAVPLALADHPCLGGAIVLRERVAVPVRGTSGLAVAMHDGAGWQVLPVAGAPAEPMDPLFAPVSGADGAIWCGTGGRLSVSATAGGPVAQWRAWPDGIRPLPGVRPVMERSGILHQLARLDPDTLVLEALFLPGGSPERRRARGYTPGTGRAVMRENRLLRLPWDERELSDFPLPEGHFLLPLLALDEGRFLLAVCSGRDGLGHFLGDPAVPPPAADAPPHACALFYSRGPRMLRPLDCVLRARQAADLSATVFAGRLLVRSALEDRCYRWNLVDG